VAIDRLPTWQERNWDMQLREEQRRAQFPSGLSPAEEQATRDREIAATFAAIDARFAAWRANLLNTAGDGRTARPMAESVIRSAADEMAAERARGGLVGLKALLGRLEAELPATIDRIAKAAAIDAENQSQALRNHFLAQVREEALRITPRSLLAEIEKHGGKVELRDAKLALRGIGVVDERIRLLVAHHRAAIVEIVKQREKVTPLE